MPLMPTRQCSDVGITTLLGRKSGLRLLTRLDLIHVMSSHRRKPLGGRNGWVGVTCEEGLVGVGARCSTFAAALSLPCVVMGIT